MMKTILAMWFVSSAIREKTLTKSTQKVNIAVACFGNEIAPSFGAARRFRLASFDPRGVADYHELNCEVEGSRERLNLMRNHGVNVLICNGIEDRVWRILEAEGCLVVAGVAGPAVDALYGYLAGRLQPRPPQLNGDSIQPHTADLVKWTNEMLESMGWQVTPVVELEIYPIDLTAMQSCPVCKRPVKLAVCCGAHAWQVDAELQEFSRVARGDCQARLYVHHVLPGLVERCSELDIELLAPDTFAFPRSAGPSGAVLPPLRGRIDGHPNINVSESSEKIPI